MNYNIYSENLKYEIEVLPERTTRLAEIRIAKGYTQAMLAEKSGISLRTLQQYESKARDISKASVSVVYALARSLECPMESLIDIYVDDITDCIRNRNTGLEYDTRFSKVDRRISPSEAKNDMNHGWKFNWSLIQDEGNEIIELYTPHDNRMQGRISYLKKDGYFFVDHVESSPKNVGHDGVYEGVGGNLFAIICYLSKLAGYEGYVSFISKKDNTLISRYKEYLHAKQVGNSQMMYIDKEAAEYLIDKYQLEGR